MKIKKSFKKIFENKFFIAIVAILAPIFLELCISGKINYEIQTLLRIGYIYAVYLLIGVFYILKKYSNFVSKVIDFIMKYRYIIALVALVFMVAFKINFSSIGMWSQYMNEGDSKNTIIGKARPIRSDEWLTQSSFMLGQAQNEEGYGVYNKNIAQGTGNMLFVSAPVSDILEFSRPLLWGFHFLSIERGFSFYWGLKLVALVLVSIELVRKITKKNDKLLPLVGGLILAIAPPMMWWLSTAIVDGYIYGTIVIVLFMQYMENLDYKIWKKLLIALGIAIALPGFTFMLYPAFQVPFGFLMAVFVISSFIKNRKELKKVDYIIMASTLLVCFALIFRFLLLTWNDIKIMMGTVYPGNRIDVGGNLTIDSIVNSYVNIFFPYTKSIANTCEPSVYIFPLFGLIVLILHYLKNTKLEKEQKDKGLIISLIVLFIIYLIWEFVGFNEVLAKVTLLYLSPASRTYVITGLIGVLLSIIMIQKFKDNKIFTKKQAIAISFISVFIAYVLTRNSIYKDFFNPLKYEIALSMIFALTYFTVTGKIKEWAFTMAIVAIVSGIIVNPIAVGISPVDSTKISSQIREIAKENEDSLWIGSSNITGQYLIANGINCLNGVNTYPNFGWLEKVDPEGTYNDIYNRFAHISIKLSKETSFELIAPDAYMAFLTYENLKDVGVKYYFTIAKESEEIEKDFNLSLKYSDEEKNQYIYEIK